MDGVTEARGQDFSLPTIVVIDLDNFFEQTQAVITDVVQPTKKGTNEGRSRFRRADRLRRRDAKRHVNFVSFLIENARGFQTISRDRTFDDDVGPALNLSPTLAQRL